MKERVLTALVLIPPVLAALFLTTPWPLLGLGLVVFVLAVRELYGMLPAPGLCAPVIEGMLLVYLVPLCAGSLRYQWQTPYALLIWAPVGVLFTFLAGFRPRPAAKLYASLWISAPLACLVALHELHPVSTIWNFQNPVLLAIVPLWVGDTLAIFVGRAFGKHLLAPKISPKKTVEGAIGNLFGCVACALGLGWLIHVAWLPALLCGLAAGIFGQLGDLFESALKRKCDVKDSGSILPGHGGLLDRIDSLLFTAPVVLLVLLITQGARR